ncbi:ArsR/SmtB family transcription factor [Proteiniphilum sp. UBA1028]|jgi:ArsR family transcriptional regulator|uniref:ArsR/SmtB family transcription factor n=1 Tax=Proteiniphilum sp. UBA1028 TaxID=1947251 RepID=UPI0025F44426|nr:metalloregulator ArsR/SmtB family transcription factor [Proteiniphilum sp. UBA1028]
MEKAEIELETKKINKAKFEEAAYLLRALANETRLCVILQLSQTAEKSVSELMEGMDCEQSLLSHHLTDMRAKGLLSCRRSGKNSFYSLKDRRVINILRCVMHCSGTDVITDIGRKLN